MKQRKKDKINRFTKKGYKHTHGQSHGSSLVSTYEYRSRYHQIISNWIKAWDTISLLDILSIIAVIIGLIIRFIKAYKLPLVSDEAYTYVHYANEPISTILSSYIYTQITIF